MRVWQLPDTNPYDKQFLLFSLFDDDSSLVRRCSGSHGACMLATFLPGAGCTLIQGKIGFWLGKYRAVTIKDFDGMHTLLSQTSTTGRQKIAAKCKLVLIENLGPRF